MSTKKYIVIFCSLFFGVLFFFLERGIVILHVPVSLFAKKNNNQFAFAVGSKKIVYYFWKHGQLDKCEDVILWSSLSKTEQCRRLVLGWLKNCKDENLIEHDTFLEFVGLSNLGNELYLSFNRSIMLRNDTILNKWRHTESLLKTCHQADKSIERIFLFVNHEAMEDAHLDFSIGLPINGFLR